MSSRMTRARIRTSGLGNPPRPQHWLAAALCVLVSLVTKLFKPRRKYIPAQRRHQEALRHLLRLVALMASRPAGPCRTTRRSTSPSRSATDGGKRRWRVASLAEGGGGGIRVLARMTAGVVSTAGLLRMVTMSSSGSTRGSFFVSTPAPVARKAGSSGQARG